MSPLKLGMIGFSEGNGHPFSFSAIVNGYDGAAMREAGWGVIADYLDLQDPQDLGMSDARVVACWAPQPEVAAGIARSAHVDSVISPDEMIRIVDAVVIARDDWQSHAPLAMPFLKAGKAVFIDKPLTLDRSELDVLTPYLENGQLMSCSALRYARELDSLRARPDQLGRIQLISGAVVLDFARYGIHLLEAAVGVTGRVPKLVTETRIGKSRHAVFHDETGLCYAITAMGPTAKRFRLSFFGERGSLEVDILDNFSSFRRALGRFVRQAREGVPAIPPAQTIAIMEALFAMDGNKA